MQDAANHAAGLSPHPSPSTPSEEVVRHHLMEPFLHGAKAERVGRPLWRLRTGQRRRQHARLSGPTAAVFAAAAVPPVCQTVQVAKPRDAGPVQRRSAMPIALSAFQRHGVSWGEKRGGSEGWEPRLRLRPKIPCTHLHLAAAASTRRLQGCAYRLQAHCPLPLPPPGTLALQAQWRWGGWLSLHPQPTGGVLLRVGVHALVIIAMTAHGASGNDCDVAAEHVKSASGKASVAITVTACTGAVYV
eukprot:366147-Chlamydomonas_euryale.AAC.8